MKRFACLLCLAWAVSATAGDKDFFPAMTGNLLAPQGNLAPNDLTFDSSFGVDGLTIGDFNNATGNDELPRRIFPASDGGFWLAGYHRNGVIVNDGIAITKLTAVGGLNTSYNGTGENTLASPLYEVMDVAKGTNDTLFFAGTVPIGGDDTDFGIYCIDNTGAPCAGFGTNGLVTYAIDLGGSSQFYGDRPKRIVAFASALYIVGDSMDGTSVANAHTAISMIKISQSNGDQDMGFGNTPGRPGLFTYDVGYRTNGNANAYDLIAWSPALFQVRLAVVGEAQASASGPDTDGFLAVVDGFSGQFDTGFNGNGKTRIIYDLGSSHEDGARRVVRLINGRLVVAGYARNDSDAVAIDELTLSRFKVDGNDDPSFGSGGHVHLAVASAQNIPFGIVERPSNRDLIVGVNTLDDLFGDSHALQAYVAFGGSGGAQHAFNLLDADAANAVDRSTIGTDLIIDGTRAVGAGQRRWRQSTGDYDFTAVRLVPTDSIFASQFGGPTSD